MTDHRRIRVLWPDHLALARGKYLPTHLAHRGTRHSMSVFALLYDRDMIPAPGTRMLEGFPDMECTIDTSAIRDGWEEGVGVVVGDLVSDGAPVSFAPRNALREAVAAWEALGYTPKIGIEFEAFVLQRDDEGGWEPYDCPGSYVYGTGPMSDPMGIAEAIHDVADAVGFRLESVNGEFDSAQFEFTLEYDDAMAAADEAFLFRAMARDVAYEMGHLLTFLPRPLLDRGGSGMHINLSLVDADGNNALLDPAAADGLSDLAHRCIAGQLHHLSAMGALCAPTVNSYKRLRPGQISGYWANWGHDHRCATVRVNPERDGSTRLENRMPDASAPIHTVVAAVLTAARLGVEHRLDCPGPETGDAIEEACTDRFVADDLGGALAALAGDDVFADAIGRGLVDQFTAIKEAELGKYLEAVGDEASARDEFTDWEKAFYLPYL
jgi:glutamine synthetase